MGRAPCCEKVGLKKGPWTPEEDQKLVAYVQEHGLGSWRALPKKAGLLRCGKSCRLRWTNYLRPDIKRGKFTLSEEQTIIQLHALLGNRWSAIASHLPKRTDNEIKNYWNTHLKKRLLKMGIDPATHKPKPDPSNLLDAKPQFSSTLSHMAQWESARLEAEARLARESLSRSHGVWSETKTFSKISSSAKSWDSNSSDFSSESDNGLPPILNCKQTSAVHFVNIDRNWENSLQGQADIMWSGSLAMSRISAGLISSSCSTAHGEQMELGSPTSTLCSFEAPCGNAIPSVTGAKAGCYPTTGLSWPDEILPDIRVVDLGKGRGGSSSDSKNLQPDKICWQWDEALRSPKKGEGAMEQGVHSPFPCLHEVALVEEDGCRPCPPSMLWSQSMEGPNVDLSSIELEGVPALASACTSSNLGGDLEHISQDITSSNNFCFSTSCNEISPEMLMNLGADKSKSHADVGYGLTTHIVYDTVLPDYKVEEENSEYWSSMLRHMVDSSSA